MDAAIGTHLAAGRHARAFDLIVPEFRDRVFRLSVFDPQGPGRRRGRDAGDASCGSGRRLPGFDGRAALGTWIYAIARNTCLMELRKRRPTVSFDDPDSHEAQQAAASIATGPADDPERDNLLRLLETLPANQQQAVRLFYLEDRSYDAVAEALDMPLGTVKNLLFRARKRLMELARPEEVHGRMNNRNPLRALCEDSSSTSRISSTVHWRRNARAPAASPGRLPAVPALARGTRGHRRGAGTAHCRAATVSPDFDAGLQARIRELDAVKRLAGDRCTHRPPSANTNACWPSLQGWGWRAVLNGTAAASVVAGALFALRCTRARHRCNRMGTRDLAGLCPVLTLSAVATLGVAFAAVTLSLAAPPLALGARDRAAAVCGEHRSTTLRRGGSSRTCRARRRSGSPPAPRATSCVTGADVAGADANLGAVVQHERADTGEHGCRAR